MIAPLQVPDALQLIVQLEAPLHATLDAHELAPVQFTVHATPGWHWIGVVHPPAGQVNVQVIPLQTPPALVHAVPQLKASGTDASTRTQ